MEENEEMESVYVLTLESIWDYDIEGMKIRVFSDFDDAFKIYEDLRETAIKDMKNFVEDDMSKEEVIRMEDFYASLSVYESGYYTQTHCNLKLEKVEVERGIEL